MCQRNKTGRSLVRLVAYQKCGVYNETEQIRKSQRFAVMVCR
jgi:hypothetical protein